MAARTRVGAIPHLPGFRRARAKLRRNNGWRQGPGRNGMAAVAVKVFPQTQAPDGNEAAETIDRGHLRRMTFGDHSLERELLQLFDRQAAILIERMRESDAAAVGSLAHTLKGSAAGVGATGVARAAEAVERAATASERARAIEGLAQAVAAARTAIAAMLAG